MRFEALEEGIGGDLENYVWHETTSLSDARAGWEVFEDYSQDDQCLVEFRPSQVQVRLQAE